MRPDFSFLTALLLLGSLLAPTGTADDTTPAPEDPVCSTRHLVTAIEEAIVWTGYACLTDAALEEASQEATTAIWLKGSTAETACTALSWHTPSGMQWFGAACGSVASPMDLRASSPCTTLDLGAQAARDLCNVFSPSTAAAELPDCGATLSPSSSTAAAELPCGIVVPDAPDIPDVPDIPDYRELIPDVPDVPDAPEIDCDNLFSAFSASAAAAPADCVPEIPDIPDVPDVPDLPDIGEIDCESLLSQSRAAADCVGNCDPGEVGATIGNVNACVNSDVDCDTLFPSAFMSAAAAQDCVGTCDPGEVGATIGTLNGCVREPDVQLCNTRDGYYGVIINGNPTCVRADLVVCPSAEGVGVIINGVHYCVDPQVEKCPPGYVGTKVLGVNGCVKEPVVCDEGYGVEPNCHTVRLCPADNVGVIVDNTQVCYDVIPDPCTPPEQGYEPACILIEDCPTGYRGAIVNGYFACVENPALCRGGGTGVEPYCVTQCPSGQYGAKVGNTDLCRYPPPDCGQDVGVPPYCLKLDCPPGTVGGHIGTTGLCYPVPETCDEGYGIKPTCVVVCPTGSVGAHVGSTGTCVPIPKVCTAGYGVEPYCVSTCPPGYVGAEVGSTSVCTPTPRACPAPESFGIEPDCHTVQECDGSDVGVEVDDQEVCRAPPRRCTAPEQGYEPACVLVEDCPDGYEGAIINNQDACVPTPVVCQEGYGLEPNCVVICPSGYIGAHIGNIGVCSPVPEPCPAPGSIGVEPDCHTAAPCPSGSYGVVVDGDSECHTVRLCPADNVGVIVDDTSVCYDVIPDECPPPAAGYEPACVTQEDCPPGYTGTVINGQEACAPTPELCDTGYGVKPNCVTLCPSGTIGVKVGSTGTCYPMPQACPVPTVGVQPDCHSFGTCPSGSHGVVVDGDAECHTARECPGEEAGVEIDSTRVCRDPPDQCTAPEVGYEPACILKEDCPSGSTGTVINGLRACVPNPRVCEEGYGLEPNCVTLCPSGEVGVELGTTSLCSPVPEACPTPSIGVEPDCHTVAPCPSGTYGVQVDGEGGCHTITVCTSGEYGVRVDSTDLCQEIPTVPDDQDNDGYSDTSELGYGSNPRDADSRRTTDDDGDLTLNYQEPYTATGYVRNLCTGAYGIVADSSCAGYAKPSGLESNSVGVDAEDRVWVWDGVCASGAQGSYTGCKNGNYAVSTTKYTGTFSGDGYGWRYVGDVPLADSYSVNLIAPCEDLEQDNDGDDVKVYHVCNVRLTVHRDGSTDMEETGVRASAGDPDDEDPQNPIPTLPDTGIEDGPYTTVERSTGDGVHYKVGAVVNVAGERVDLVQEDTVDAGALPVTFSVPTGEAPMFGPDADGDGLPAYADIPAEAWTIHDTATLTTTTAPASPVRLPIDNDDGEHLLGGPSKSVTVPSWMQPGPDGDMDGIPSTVTIEYTKVTVFTDGSYAIERVPEQDESRAVDPDDSDEDDPVQQAEDPVPVTTGPLGHSESLPAVTTPPVEDQDVTTPGVTAPATCTVSPCDTETVVLEEDEVTVPGTPGAGVPSSEQVCATVPDLCDEEYRYCAPAGIVCVGPHDGYMVTEPGEPQTVTTPGASAPAICQAAPDVCLPPTTLVEEETHHFDGIGPQQVTPAVVVSVAWTGFDGYVDPNVGTFTTIGPIVIPGPVPVTVCANTCSLPVPPEASGEGSVTVMVVAGEDEYVVTQPVSF